MTVFISALLLGLFGSFHCAGMCGPIALALPLHDHSAGNKVLGGTIYNIGRTLTYGMMGAVFGLLGQGAGLLGLQQKISVLMGGLMILTVLFPALFRSGQAAGKWSRAIGHLRQQMGKFLSVRSFSSLFFIGLLNGLLPCGLVYIAIAGAVASGNIVHGTLYMVLFGLGTIPMMLALTLAGNMLSMSFRKRINKIISLLVVVIGILFILRGLSLGIPFLSPPREKIEKKFEKSIQEESIEMSIRTRGDCCSFLLK